MSSSEELMARVDAALGEDSGYGKTVLRYIKSEYIRAGFLNDEQKEAAETILKWRSEDKPGRVENNSSDIDPYYYLPFFTTPTE